MQIKKVISGDEARNVMYSGFKIVADTVANTAGPSGRNIAIQESWSGPKVTKDGVTVAKSITLISISILKLFSFSFKILIPSISFASIFFFVFTSIIFLSI